MSRSINKFSDERVRSVSADIAAAIDAATFGLGSWEAVPKALSHTFPGSWGCLHSTNFTENRLNFVLLENMESGFAQSLAEHFAYINPWSAYWNLLKGTVVAASEDVFPARTFSRSEFYNDWLIPQGTEAAACIKVPGEAGEAVYALLHFPLSKSDIYSGAAVEILKRVRGNFERSVNLARLLRASTETATAKAALVERTKCAAFVVDGDRRLHDGNLQSEHLFRSKRAVAIRNGRCHLQHPDADDQFGAALKELSAGVPTLASRIAFRTSTDIWEISLAAIPTADPAVCGLGSLLPWRRLILVLVNDLGSPNGSATNLNTFSSLFGLTPSEIAFCNQLLAGESVSTAADQLAITEGTARTRLKAIFHKTGTSRQGQLMLLLSRAL